jgi:hypothetical protein
VTVRFDVVNVLDTVYQIRSGTGIGVFAPQYGPRRGYFLGLKKKICTDATIGECNPTPKDTHSDFVALPSAPLSGPYDWTGLYLGLNAGGAFAANSNSASGGGLNATANDTLTGFIGGAQIGANYQTGPLVLGFEALRRLNAKQGIAPRRVVRFERNALGRDVTRPRRRSVRSDHVLCDGGRRRSKVA